EAGRDGFWLARWLAARGVEAHVIHPSSVALSREHRRQRPVGWTPSTFSGLTFPRKKRTYFVIGTDVSKSLSSANCGSWVGWSFVNAQNASDDPSKFGIRGSAVNLTERTGREPPVPSSERDTAQAENQRRESFAKFVGPRVRISLAPESLLRTDS